MVQFAATMASMTYAERSRSEDWCGHTTPESNRNKTWHCCVDLQNSCAA